LYFLNQRHKSFFSRNLRFVTMEQHALKSVNICLNTKIYSLSETPGAQSSNLYLNVVHFYYISVS
jgi:hypothetical protein